MVNDVSEFIERFSELAPWPRARFDGGEDVGEFKMMRKIELPHHKPTLGESVKRIAFTVIGLVLVIGGVLIGPVPGPWSLPMILAGLAVLAQEFDWAKDLRHWLKQRSKAVASRWRQRRERAQ